MRELWDLMSIRQSCADFVLGRGHFAVWPNVDRALPYVKGSTNPTDEKDVAGEVESMFKIVDFVVKQIDPETGRPRSNARTERAPNGPRAVVRTG